MTSLRPNRRRANPFFEVRVAKLRDPIGNTTHALLNCPRCLRAIGVTMTMLLGRASIICRGLLGNTGKECRGHYFFDQDKQALEFVGTRSRRYRIEGAREI